MAQTYPFQYGNVQLTLPDLLQFRTVAFMHPEFRRRVFALMEEAARQGVPLGIGTGWRIQPSNAGPGFAQKGNSNHEGFPADDVSPGAVAADMVPGPSWGWMAANCARFGLREFTHVNDEPWHLQPSEIPAGRDFRKIPWDLQTFPLPGGGGSTEDEDEMPTFLIKARDGSDAQRFATFWWDGQRIGWVRSETQVNVGLITGQYKVGDGGQPLSNFGVDEIQAMIDQGWSGGTIPPGFTPPPAVDSGTS